MAGNKGYKQRTKRKAAANRTRRPPPQGPAGGQHYEVPAAFKFLNPRVGDYVYFEISSTAPYQVRRIEELNKTNSGNVEAKVLCFFRRRDVPRALLRIADRAERIDDRSLINTRRLMGISAKANAGVNGDVSAKTVSDDEACGTASENGLVAVKEEEVKEEGKPREVSESPKPMQVDTGDDDNEDNAEELKPGVEKESVEAVEESDDDEKAVEGGYGLGGLPKGSELLEPKERHLLRQHELFLSRQVESLPATHIRGKCTVTLLSEVETPECYLSKDDSFFYSLVYDPVAMTLLADKGEVRVGEKYQCDVPEDVEADALVEDNKENGNLVIAEEEEGDQPVVTSTEREVLVYHPHHNLTDRDIDQFLIVARAVGTFSRALDTSSSMKLPSLHMTAAAASRDVTLLHAMALLHQAGYDIGQAVKFLVPPPSKQHYPLDADKTTSHNTVSLGGPILCRDQMEEWSAAEANLFEEAIEKYGKDFNDIRGDFLPWKSLRDIIEYYYMWKTTNRYVEVKKNKAVEQESKLKQVYIPNYNKPNPNLVGPPNPSGQPVKGTSPCESCEAVESSHWYGWGPAHLQLRLCAECWSLWKKNGGLKRVHEYESYDLDGAASQDMLNPTQQAQMQKNQATALLTSGALTRGNAAVPPAPPGRNGGIAGRPTGGQVVARLPPNHPQQVAMQQKASSMAGGSAASMAPKTRVAFFLNTTLSMRIARRLAPKSLLNIRRSARRPFLPINGHAVKQYCTMRQPMEIIRAAKQMKGNKLSDAALAQLAASIIASGSQFAHITASPAHAAQKRPLVGADKQAPPAKRQQQQQHSQQGQHHQHRSQQQTSSHGHGTSSSSHHSAQPAHSLHGAATTSAQPKASHAGSSKGGAARAHDLKPTAAVPPISIPANVIVPPGIAAAVAKASLAFGFPQQFAASISKAAASAPSVMAIKETLPSTVNVPKKSTTRADSRWSGVEDRLLFLAGPRLKVVRKRICSKKVARRIALHPCRTNDFVNKQLPGLQGLFG